MNEIVNKGPTDVVEKILKAEFGMEKMDGNEFYAVIYDKWLELHKPYWELNDAREYTFKAILAAYQVGVSTILEKYGY